MEWYKSLKGAGGWVLMLLATIASAMSLIKAIVYILNVGLTPFLGSIVDYYRGLLKPLYDLIYLIPWPFVIPEYAIDLFVVYLIGVGISYRIYYFCLFRSGGVLSIFVPYNPVLLSHTLTIRKTQKVLVEILSSVAGQENQSKLWGKTIAISNQALISIALIPILIIVFFAFNGLK